MAPHPAPHLGARGHLDPGRVFLGAGVLTVGVLYALDSLGVLNAGRVIDRFWPLLVIAFAASRLAVRGESAAGPIVLIAVGTLLLLATTNVLQGDAWGYVWPVVLIGIGLSILLGRSGAAVPPGAAAEDVVSATGIFSGPKLRPRSRRFRHASLTAIFGGVTLDLRDATLDPAGATVTATAAFGGIDVLLPHGWRVVLKSLPILAGISDKTEPTGALPAEAPTLRVDALALFGGVELKHEP